MPDPVYTHDAAVPAGCQLVVVAVHARTPDNRPDVWQREVVTVAPAGDYPDGFVEVDGGPPLVPFKDQKPRYRLMTAGGSPHLARVLRVSEPKPPAPPELPFTGPPGSRLAPFPNDALN